MPGESGDKVIDLLVFMAVAYGVAFLLDYAAVLPLYTRPLGGSVLGEAMLLGLLVARMWVPSLGVIIVLRLHGEGFGYIKSLIRMPSMQSLVATALLIIGGYAVSLLISYLFGLGIGPCGIPGLGIGMILVLLAAGVLAGISVNAIVALGEEIAWRGYLLDMLGSKLGFWGAALLAGIMWGLWHAPLVVSGYNFSLPVLRDCGEGGGRVYALAVFALFTMSLGLVLAWLRKLTGNVYLAAVGHGTVNAIAGLYAVLVRGSRLIAPPAGISVSLAFLIVLALIAPSYSVNRS